MHDARPSSIAVSAVPDLDGLPREIGVKDDGRPGPLVLLTGGLHGNEPGGVRAIRELFEALKDTPTAGRVVGLAGNLAALERGVRHQGQDLNRMWTEEHVRGLARRPPEDDRPDEGEMRALFSAIEVERDMARRQAREIVLIDLHSTSADGGAFSVVPDSIPSRRLARALGLPVVLGLDERIEGPLMTWLVSQGDTATVVEGGQHDGAETKKVLFAALFAALDHLRVIPENDERLERAHALLREALGDAPPVADLVYAHVIDDHTGFVMRPGYRNFDPIAAGEIVADEAGQPVQAPIGGYMLMPLYQGLGTEGFFLCRSVGRTWLFASRLLRHSFFEHGLRVLPGVKGLDVTAGRIRVKRGAHGWLARLLHLFGYRKNAPVGDITEWTRRPQ